MNLFIIKGAIRNSNTVNTPFDLDRMKIKILMDNLINFLNLFMNILPN